MNEEIFKLLAFVKNDKQYFDRIEELRAAELNLAHIREIASTLEKAEKIYAEAKQNQETIINEAKKQAAEINNQAVLELQNLRKMKEGVDAKKSEIKATKEALDKKLADTVELEKTLKSSIEEHRRLTALRNAEVDETVQMRRKYEDKTLELKRIINS